MLSRPCSTAIRDIIRSHSSDSEELSHGCANDGQNVTLYHCKAKHGCGALAASHSEHTKYQTEASLAARSGVYVPVVPPSLQAS